MDLKYFLIIIVLILISNINSIITVRSSGNMIYNYIVQNYSNVSLLYVLTGIVTNLGDESIIINQTDIMYFDYPLNTEDQIVHRINAFVNNIEYNYSIIDSNGKKYLYIDSPYSNGILNQGEYINVSVRYVVRVDMAKRIENIIDFMKVDDPYVLINKAGQWSDLEQYINETTTGLTSLWNYTNPLIKLLAKYINRTVGRNNPFSYLINILNWIDNSIIYSTRVPPRYPWEVIVEGAGDCDDQSNLLITILRSFKIPCFLEIGVVYVGETYYLKRSVAEGYFNYEFIGGGGHGWIVVYIPPWGWIRVDPIVRENPFTGRREPLYKIGVKYALFYILPTVVLERVFEKDYVEESVRSIEEIRNRRIKIDLILEVYRIDELD
ncbi:MAG: transglutaminase-like domain-containing protein [Desulfurococcaceae archaeon]